MTSRISPTISSDSKSLTAGRPPRRPPVATRLTCLSDPWAKLHVHRPAGCLAHGRSLPAVCRHGPQECRLPAGRAGVQLSAEHQAHLRDAVQPQRGKATGNELAALGDLHRESAAPPVGKQRSQSGDAGALPFRASAKLHAAFSARVPAPGPCPSFLPPFLCCGAARLPLSNNRLLQQYNAARTPEGRCTAKRFFWSRAGQETTTV